MIVINQTGSDYWFGPLHLPAGVGQQITVDDTSATSLYLTEDVVADAINNLYINGKITVTSAADPFPRPTGVPQLLHGDGSPEGLFYASQGSLYMRRDASGAGGLYVKTTGITLATGWQTYSTASVTGGFVTLYDSGYLAAAAAAIDSGAGGFSISLNHLKALLIARGDTAAVATTIQLQFNGDTGANYDQGGMYHGASFSPVMTADDVAASTSLGGSCYIPGANANTAKAGLAQLDVPFYSNSTFHKIGLLNGGEIEDTAATNNNLQSWNTIQWRSIAAITRVKVTLAAGNFAAGSRLIVYGYN
jgi:hypothetical protein